MTAGVPGVGEVAPSFRLRDQEGREVSLAELLGRRIVLYFYPQDDTPGCTTQACGLRDAMADLGDVTVLGVSPDDADSHRRFHSGQGLPFSLLSDPDGAVAAAYGALAGRSRLRRRPRFTRAAFIIGPDGRIEHAWSAVSPVAHAALVRSALAGAP